MKNRILFDSCILISASVLVGSTDVDLDIKHHFYDECVELFSFVQKNLAKRIGIVTSTIEGEARGVLEKVIEGELKQRKIEKENDFELFSRVLNICDIRMRKLISCLQRDPIDQVDVGIKILLIEKMYSELKREAEELPKNAVQKKELVPKYFKKTIDWFELFKKQDEMEHSQILNLLRKDVEFDDMRILAEAYHLQMVYLNNE